MPKLEIQGVVRHAPTFEVQQVDQAERERDEAIAAAAAGGGGLTGQPDPKVRAFVVAWKLFQESPGSEAALELCLLNFAGLGPCVLQQEGRAEDDVVGYGRDLASPLDSRGFDLECPAVGHLLRLAGARATPRELSLPPKEVGVDPLVYAAWEQQQELAKRLRKELTPRAFEEVERARRALELLRAAVCAVIGLMVAAHDTPEPSPPDERKRGGGVGRSTGHWRSDGVPALRSTRHA